MSRLRTVQLWAIHVLVCLRKGHWKVPGYGYYCNRCHAYKQPGTGRWR